MRSAERRSMQSASSDCIAGHAPHARITRHTTPYIASFERAFARLPTTSKRVSTMLENSKNQSKKPNLSPARSFLQPPLGSCRGSTTMTRTATWQAHLQPLTSAVRAVCLHTMERRRHKHRCLHRQHNTTNQRVQPQASTSAALRSAVL